MTEMRPDVDGDQADAEGGYGNDTGFATEATRPADPEVEPTGASDQEDPGTGAD